MSRGAASVGAAALAGPAVLTALCRALRAALPRSRRLEARLAADLARADDAPALRRAGEVLKIQQDAVPAGADRVCLAFPWAPDEAIEVPLQRDLSPRGNVERLFRRARGLEAARAQIAERLAAAQARTAALQGLLAAAAALVPSARLVGPAAPVGQPSGPAGQGGGPAALAAALPALLREAARLGVRAGGGAEAAIRPAAPRPRPASKALPAGVQRFATAAGAELLIGRNATANDALVTRLARGGDVWLHRKDQTGAHGLLRCGGARGRGSPRAADAPPPAADLREAAMLVAWLSGVARDEAADIAWTHARHVRKGKGLPAGAVYVRFERVARVSVVREVIDALYARREALGAGVDGR